MFTLTISQIGLVYITWNQSMCFNVSTNRGSKVDFAWTNQHIDCHPIPNWGLIFFFYTCICQELTQLHKTGAKDLLKVQANVANHLKIPAMSTAAIY